MPMRTSIAYLVQEFDLSCRVSVHVRHTAEEFSPHSNSAKFDHISASLQTVSNAL